MFFIFCVKLTDLKLYSSKHQPHGYIKSLSVFFPLKISSTIDTGHCHIKFSVSNSTMPDIVYAVSKIDVLFHVSSYGLRGHPYGS